MSVGEREEAKTVGQRLKKLRRAMGATQEEFAEQIGVSTSHYRKMELGVYRISLSKITILIRKYKINYHYLLLGDEHESCRMS